MSKVSFAIALSLSCLAAPVLAADPGASTSQAKSSSSGSWAGATGHALVRVTSTAVGGTLGLPVAAARMMWWNDVEQAKSMPWIGESTHPGFVWMSRAIVIPSAVFIGALSAPMYSGVNSWRVSADKPFSPEAFNFGKLDETICPP